MATFEAYKARVNQRGETERERTLYYEKDYLKRLAVNSLSCKPCLINEVEQSLIIDDGTLPYYKEVKSLPDEYFNAGDLVEWADAKWLIVSCDWDKEVYTYGKMQQCNYALKWQNSAGEVVERWSIILSASKYNNGEKYNNIIVVGSNQLMVYLPIDNETLALRSDKRLMVDFNTDKPKCYDITRVDTVTMGYDGVAEPRCDGKGCVLLILTETEINPDVDRIDLMLCDYVDPSDIPSADIMSFVGMPEIRIGGRKTFTANVQNPVFTITSAEAWRDKIEITIAGQKAVVKIANIPDMVGATFRIECVGEGQRQSVLIDVVSAM